MLLLFIIFLHYKRDGTLDMRYKSSKKYLQSEKGYQFERNGYHYKKDGTLDMRYHNSKQYVNNGGDIFGPDYDEY